MEIFQNLSLTHFSLKECILNETGWRNLLREIPKCTTLISLEFWHIHRWGSPIRADGTVEFAIELAQFLKNNPIIVSTNKANVIGYYCDNDVYTIHIAPILEQHSLLQNLKILKTRANDKEGGFLVAEAIGTRFATKPSSCYTILKVNVDVLVSYLSSTPLSRGKKLDICYLHN